MSRAEAAVRRVTHEWVLACNTKHLDDLLELYTADALVLRSNYPPVRGAAAVRDLGRRRWIRAVGVHRTGQYRECRNGEESFHTMIPVGRMGAAL